MARYHRKTETTTYDLTVPTGAASLGRRLGEAGTNWSRIGLDVLIRAALVVFATVLLWRKGELASSTPFVLGAVICIYALLILFPLLIALTALCGYLLSRRALGPVAQITQTVRNIQRERDLSKRVRLGEGRDEIYTLAQTFDSLLDQLEASFQREKQFTSDVAHELRTPLAVALMQGEALLARQELSPEARKEVELMCRKLRSMSEMASQLLLLSRADQGRERLTLETLDLSELSQLEAEEFAEVASRRQIALEADIQPGVSVVADQTLLLRLWGNLLQNAVTYGKEGGHIWMKLTVEESWAVLRVQDDGIGISPEQLPKIWDRFFQADPSRSGDSSGLGLSMVQWIAAAHGGRASAESKLGEGSVFTVRLPLSGPEEKAGRHGP